MQEVLDNLIALTGLTENDTQIFYDTLYGYSSTAAVFREGERPDREDTLRNWHKTVTEGKIDDKFWRWQWFVGLVHIPRGITNPFILNMMSRVQQAFAAKCRQALPTEEADELFGAFKRVTDVIAALIAEGYFQSYIQAMERMSGQCKTLIGRMVNMEVEQMLAESRPT